MDHNQLYETNYKQYFSFAEQFIKAKCIKYKNEGYSFNHTYNEIQKNGSDYCKLINAKLQSDQFAQYASLFNKRYQIFEENHIINIIEKKIKPLLKKNKQFKKEVIDQLIYNQAKYDALKSALRIFSKYSRLYDLMFILNSFNKFELVKYGCQVENVPLFKKLIEKVYPTPKVSKAKISNSSDQTDDYLNVEDVAKLTNYAKATIYDLKHKGLIPFYKNGAKLQFKKSEIIKWMEKGKGTTKEDIEDKANEYLLNNKF